MGKKPVRGLIQTIRLLRFDKALLTAVFAISCFGLLMVYDASVVEALRVFHDKYHFIRLQFVWFIAGWIVALSVFLMPVSLLKKAASLMMAVTVVMLIAVLIPGLSERVQGARRWLNIGGLAVQPSEICKYAYVLYLARWLENKGNLLSFLTISLIVLALVVLQPDFGTAAVIVGTGFFLYFLSGAPIFCLLVTSLFGLFGGLLLILSSSYRKARLLTFLNPTRDPLGTSYHLRQILIAIGSGGLWGLGLGKSRQKHQFLPEATTDSIFAIIAEETGFLGATILVLVFLFIIYRGFQISRKAKDTFSKLTAAGITSWLGLQVLINLSAMVSLVPLTGLPLPFISYGGSSLMISFIAIGTLLNISQQASMNAKL